jgi:hypothetical protein
MAFQHLGHRLPQVLRQVETVGNLDSIRRTARDALGVGAAPIPTDDLDPRTVLQPGRQRCRRSVWQQVDEAVLLQIDQDGPIGVALPFRPVVDSEHAWCGCRHHRRPADQAEQCGWTGRHPQAPDDPGPELATQRKRQQTDDLGQTSGTARVGGDHGWQSLGEDAT